jgi:hypothetical protein
LVGEVVGPVSSVFDELVELLPGQFFVEAVAPPELKSAVKLGNGCQASVELFGFRRIAGEVFPLSKRWAINDRVWASCLRHKSA